MTPRLRRMLFETLYQHKSLYRFASTVPFAGQWRVWQRQILPRLRGHDVLELGCGLGDLLADMLEAGYACHAVEHSPQMVEAARETLRKRQLGTPGLIIQGSAQSLHFTDGSFDTVVSTFPAEYIYDPETIAEVERVLRSGGRLLVIEGANLLAVGLFQPVLLLLQMLVYGPTTLFHSRKRRDMDDLAARRSQKSRPENVVKADQRSEIHTQVVENAWFGQRIPLEAAGLRRRSELVRSQRWEIYLTIGEKV